jgi:hypothetical protein
MHTIARREGLFCHRTSENEDLVAKQMEDAHLSKPRQRAFLTAYTGAGASAGLRSLRKFLADHTTSGSPEIRNTPTRFEGPE